MWSICLTRKYLGEGGVEGIMPLGPFVASEVVGWLLGALLMLVLAAWLLRLDLRSPVNRAFAVLLVVLSVLNIASALLYGGERTLARWLYPLAMIATPFAMLYFVGVYRATRITGVLHPLLLATNASAGIVLAAMFLVDQSLFWPPANTVRFGPLFVVAGLAYLVSAVVALQLGLDYLRAAKGPERRSLIVMALGFSFLPGYVAAQDLLFIDLLGEQSATGFAFVAHALAVVAVGPLMILFAALARAAWVTGDEEVKRDLSRFLLVFLFPLLAVGALFGLYALGEDYTKASTGIEGAWTVVFPLFVAYAVLRHRLSGVDAHSQVVVPALLVLTGLTLLAFVVHRVVEDAGYPANAWVVGLSTAGLLAPLWPVWQRMALRALERCLEPGATPGVDSRTKRS